LPKYQRVKILGCQNFNIPKNPENTLTTTHQPKQKKEELQPSVGRRE
jgi:hypothetical protein